MGIHQIGPDGAVEHTGVVGELDILKDLLTDTETSIAGLEGDIEDLREELNLKAEDIQPVGSIRYSAAPDMGDDWLKCNGSFVSEEASVTPWVVQ